MIKYYQRDPFPLTVTSLRPLESGRFNLPEEWTGKNLPTFFTTEDLGPSLLENHSGVITGWMARLPALLPDVLASRPGASRRGVWSPLCHAPGHAQNASWPKGTPALEGHQDRNTFTVRNKSWLRTLRFSQLPSLSIFISQFNGWTSTQLQTLPWALQKMDVGSRNPRYRWVGSLKKGRSKRTNKCTTFSERLFVYIAESDEVQCFKI